MVDRARIELALVVDLDERLEAEVEGLIDQRAQFAGTMEHGEQQHQVGAGHAQRGQLTAIDDESLARTGTRTAARIVAQIVERAVEPVRLAQH